MNTNANARTGSTPHDAKWIKKLSKFLALALRHAPHSFGLDPDADGWVPLADFVGMLPSHRRFRDATEADVREVVRSSDKQRYEIREADDADPPMLRARYGHSYREVVYEPAQPPEVLLHGTGSDALAAILDQGLRPMSRHYVHLTPDEDVAGVVGRRHAGALVMLRVRAQEAWEEGLIFHQAAPLIWLAKEIPARFIDAP